MKTLVRNRWVNACFYAALCVLITLIFQFNFLNISPEAFFHTFQLNGQSRVLGGIIADARGLDKKGANLGKVYRGTGDDPLPPETIAGEQTYEIFPKYGEEKAELLIQPYRSQFGLQAIVYSFIHSRLGLSKLHQLQFIPAVLLAVSIVILFSLYRRIYDSLFAFLVLIALIGSPWLVAMGRNLYWNPFLFFLPSIFAALLYLERRTAVRLLLLALIFASLLVKSLSNYEFLTTVTLLACSVFIVAPYFDRNIEKPRPDFKMAAIVFSVCVFAFAIAFLVHAGTRGDTLQEGINNIVEQDVMRRTYGDASKFTHETRDSLNASPLDVLAIYVFEWPTKRLMIVPGKLFWALLAFSIGGMIFKFVIRHPTRQRDLVAYVTFFAVPASWFVFAKGHSYSHTHINFVLWNIGFMPVLFYVCIQTGMAMYERFCEVFRRPARAGPEQ